MTITPSVFMGLILTPGLIAVGQVLFKIASRSVEPWSLTSLIGLATNSPLLVALFMYASGTVIWVFLLRTVNLSHAYMFMAMTFVLVPLLSYFILGETITIRQIVGTALIIVGLIYANAG